MSVFEVEESGCVIGCVVFQRTCVPVAARAPLLTVALRFLCCDTQTCRKLENNALSGAVPESLKSILRELDSSNV